MKKAHEVYQFWFKELTEEQWFKKDEKVDAQIKERFFETYQMAIKGELASWREDALGALCEIIVIDQFARNMFRGTPQSFENDPLALILSQEALRRGLDHKLKTMEKAFMYMPFMHSESAIIHKEAIELFKAPGLEENLDFEIKHKLIIDRFGRYPHRNEILGRKSTQEEIEFLKEPNSGF